MKKWLITTMLVAFSSTVPAQSVGEPTGNPPRFPKAYKELVKQTKPPSNNWLLDANDDTERFRRLQVVLSGTDIPMIEISYRYEELYTAITKNNWDMGIYHWEKLRDRMNTSGMKRPARTQNIEDMFLESGVWKEMYDALKARNAKKVHSVFQSVREVCLACHVAEKVGFLNDSTVFSRTEKFPPLGK
jgi:hypothetical protein